MTRKPMNDTQVKNFFREHATPAGVLGTENSLYAIAWAIVVLSEQVEEVAGQLWRVAESLEDEPEGR